MSSSPLQTRTTSVEQTRVLAGAVAELARPGDLLLLVGDLGAGKTAFTQGFGAGLGIDEQITSPTFALVQGYTGRLDLNHLDVYRLEQINEALDLGLSELLDEGSVTLIEWGDTITSALPRDYLEVSITFGDEADDRVLELRPVGPQWQARMRALSIALAAWAAPTDPAPADATPADATPADGLPADPAPADPAPADASGSDGELPAGEDGAGAC